MEWINVRDSKIHVSDEWNSTSIDGGDSIGVVVVNSRLQHATLMEYVRLSNTERFSGDICRDVIGVVGDLDTMTASIILSLSSQFHASCFSGTIQLLACIKPFSPSRVWHETSLALRSASTVVVVSAVSPLCFAYVSLFCTCFSTKSQISKPQVSLWSSACSWDATFCYSSSQNFLQDRAHFCAISNSGWAQFAFQIYWILQHCLSKCWGCTSYSLSLIPSKKKCCPTQLSLSTLCWFYSHRSSFSSSSVLSIHSLT